MIFFLIFKVWNTVFKMKIQHGRRQNDSNMQMFFKIHKDHITKGLHGALLDFEQQNSELKIADPMWRPLKYNSILMLHKFSIMLFYYLM